MDCNAMMDDIIEIEDFINKPYQKMIHERLTSNKFPWFFNPNMVTPLFMTDDPEYNHVGFNHFLYEEREAKSPLFEFIHPLLLQIEAENIFKFQILERARFNLTQSYPSAKRDHHLPHVDSDYPHYNAIYYVNDSDGDTFIFNETNEDYDPNTDVKTMFGNKFTVKKRVTPKMGKLLIFPGHYYHASSFPKTSKYRIILNVNFGKLDYGNLGTT